MAIGGNPKIRNRNRISLENFLGLIFMGVHNLLYLIPRRFQAMFSFIKSGFQKVKQALSKTRLQLSYRIKSLFGQPWEEETFERLEEILYEADLGTACAGYFVKEVRQFLLKEPKASSDQILALL